MYWQLFFCITMHTLGAMQRRRSRLSHASHARTNTRAPRSRTVPVVVLLLLLALDSAAPGVRLAVFGIVRVAALLAQFSSDSSAAESAAGGGELLVREVAAAHRQRTPGVAAPPPTSPTDTYATGAAAQLLAAGLEEARTTRWCFEPASRGVATGWTRLAFGEGDAPCSAG